MSEERLDELLRLAAASPPELPSRLQSRVAAALRRARWRRRGWAIASGTAAAAGVAMAASGWWSWSDHPPPVHDPRTVVAPEPPPREPIRAVVESSPGMLAVPVETRDPAVTIIWLFPVVETVADSDASSSSAPEGAGKGTS